MKEYFGEEQYDAFVKSIHTKYDMQNDECFWLIGEITKTGIST